MQLDDERDDALDRFNKSAILAVIVEDQAGEVDILLCLPPDPRLIETLETTLARLRALAPTSDEWKKRAS